VSKNGNLLISLDFELFWGVHDKRNIKEYGDAILAVRQVLPKMISDFDQYNVKCTFATVGFLFSTNSEELKKYLPRKKPGYSKEKLSPYPLIKNLSSTGEYYFAPKLIELIKRSGNHEIATHTFSHFYCLEDGQQKEDFNDDIAAAVSIAAKKNIALNSIVFPRNQVNEDYFSILKKNGIKAYRGTEKSWFYVPDKGENESLIKRLFRLVDSYINISGHHTFKFNRGNSTLYNLPSSRFLRPFNPKLRWIESLRIKRILKGMNYAAKNNEIFHLWWHPHNFGRNQKENFIALRKILNHYAFLNKTYGFKSTTMEGLASTQFEK
jgi:peptidoglycan/xylan/chitin deacetylase (PgdA/CDA1 family)